MDDEDQVIDQNSFADFLQTKLKLNRQPLCTGYPGMASVNIEGKKIVVSTTVKFGKRYMKYLTNKYLKAQDIKNYLRVIATDKLGYRVKFLNLQDGGDQD